MNALERLTHMLTKKHVDNIVLSVARFQPNPEAPNRPDMLAMRAEQLIASSSDPAMPPSVIKHNILADSLAECLDTLWDNVNYHAEAPVKPVNVVKMN
jgi:hypothetical protein